MWQSCKFYIISRSTKTDVTYFSCEEMGFSSSGNLETLAEDPQKDLPKGRFFCAFFSIYLALLL